MSYLDRFYYQDGGLKTGEGGRFKPNIQATNAEIEVGNDSIVYDDFPGFDPTDRGSALNPTKHSAAIAMIMFHVSAKDKGGTTSGQSINARFMVFVNAGYSPQKDKYILSADSGVAPAAYKWTDKE